MTIKIELIFLLSHRSTRLGLLFEAHSAHLLARTLRFNSNGNLINFDSSCILKTHNFWSLGLSVAGRSPPFFLATSSRRAYSSNATSIKVLLVCERLRRPLIYIHGNKSISQLIMQTSRQSRSTISLIISDCGTKASLLGINYFKTTRGTDAFKLSSLSNLHSAAAAAAESQTL